VSSAQLLLLILIIYNTYLRACLCV